MIKLKISVTKDILEKSKDCEGSQTATNCAIAIAVREIWPKAGVGLSVINPFGSFDSRYIVKIPKEAGDFVSRFDESSPEQRVEMNEISFEVSIPDSVIDKMNIDEIRPLLVNHPTLELIDQ